MNVIRHGSHRSWEGIDTILFKLNRNYVNSSMWFHQRDEKSYEPAIRSLIPGISLRSQKTDYGTCYYCDIQYERLIMDADILFQIEAVVYQLILKGYIIIPSKYAGQPVFVSHYGLPILIKLSALDFFFDFKQKDAIFSEIPHVFTTTRYSPDHKKKTSLICMYDKNAEFEVMLKKGRLQEITKTDAPIRCEIRLRSSNSQYLNLENLKGTYQQVFWRYRMVLAKIWRRYGESVGEIKSDIRHENFHQIQFLSGSGEKLPNIPELEKKPKDSFLQPSYLKAPLI
ncbi:MAG: hypothetical protein K6G18_13875 [Treponema sp.]|nr:hypothetical protein [Treponema sp.]